MTVISKAALAAELRVSKSRVSQYVTTGLPVRSDGKIDREVALDWIGQNLRSGSDHRKGPSRARDISPPRPVLHSAASTEQARRVRTAMAKDVVWGVMSIACDLELPMRAVYALAMNMQHYCSDIVGGEGLPLDAEAVCPDWESVASGQEEPFDMAAWEAFRAEMYERAS